MSAGPTGTTVKATVGLDGDGPQLGLNVHEDEVRPGRVLMTSLNTAGNYDAVLSLTAEDADMLGRRLRQSAQRARQLGERHHVE